MTKFEEFKQELGKIISPCLLLVGSFYGWDEKNNEQIEEYWGNEDIPEKLKYETLVESVYNDNNATWVYYFPYFDITVKFFVEYYSSYWDSEWYELLKITQVFPKPTLKIDYVSEHEAQVPDKALLEYITNKTYTGEVHI